MYRRELCAAVGVASVSGCLRLQGDAGTDEPTDSETADSDGSTSPGDGGSTSAGDDRSTGFPDDPTVGIESVWEAPDRGESVYITDQRAFLAGKTTTRTTADGDRITVGGVAAIASDGTVEWRRYEDRTFGEAPIRRRDGELYAGVSGLSAEADVEAEGPPMVVSLTDDGTERWRFEPDNAVDALSPVLPGTVIAGTARLESDGSGTGRVYALDRDTGEPEWEAGIEGEFPREIGAEAGTAYVALWNEIRAYDIQSGDVRWRIDARPQDVQVVDGTVYTSYGEEIRAYASADGEQIWSGELFDLPSTALVIDNGTVFVGSADTGVYAFDAETGEQRFRHQADSEIVGVSLGDDRLWATTENDTVIALSRDGEPLFRTGIDGDISLNTHGTADNRLIVTGVHGTIGYRIVES